MIAAGCTTVNLPDTVGYSTPDEIAEFFTRIRSRVPNADRAIFSAHNHDDLGLAVANSLAAVQAGVRQVECTINGIGERAGNAALEEIVMAMRVRSDRLPYETGINTEQLYASSQLLTSLTGEAVQANKAVVGRNAFAHEAGIHQDGMLKDRRTYEIMRPEDVGAPVEHARPRQTLRPACGPSTLRAAGSTLTKFELDRVYRSMIELADRQKSITDANLHAIVDELRGHTSAAHEADELHHPVVAGYGHGV